MMLCSAVLCHALSWYCTVCSRGSGFINDTPTVAMMLPLVGRWAQRLGQPASKFMIPLSFSALLGGTCTLIGTSTNLVLQVGPFCLCRPV